ncbi:response regulator transcription factor [Brasilonema sp. UFV-L1]|uniref:LuxR C-terminal-related transcriptional regulator n=1 Tax=Brasilonema sp. UFV-L1 TaxID=2234130 RepID=UPI00145CE15B|nr:response regulator transcription factor [Brasilonema sp. UFV-L1]NMG10983.1 DNA-binding response regulator [Brasilonema sp. UFV-L1]
MYNSIRVLLASRHSLVGAGIRATLTVEEDLILVGEANDGYKVQELNRKLQPDLLIIDLDLPNLKLLDSIAYLHKYCPDLKVLALAHYDKVNLSILRASGIAGCVFKSEQPQTLISAIRTVAKGNTWYGQGIVEEVVQQKLDESSQDGEVTLTQREQQVLGMIAQGWDNASIATELCLGHQTVRNYISRIYTKLAVSSRVEAVIWAMKHNVS